MRKAKVSAASESNSAKMSRRNTRTVWAAANTTSHWEHHRRMNVRTPDAGTVSDRPGEDSAWTVDIGATCSRLVAAVKFGS